jgi:hypothetical protein
LLPLTLSLCDFGNLFLSAGAPAPRAQYDFFLALFFLALFLFSDIAAPATNGRQAIAPAS